MEVEITDWVYIRLPKAISSKVIIHDENITAGDIILQMVVTIQSLIVEEYLPQWRIKSVYAKLFELNSDLKIVLGPEDLFIVWKILDSAITQMEVEAIKTETYEGIINLQKLKEII